MLGCEKCSASSRAVVERARAHVRTDLGKVGIQLFRGGRLTEARAALERAIALFHDSAGDLRAVIPRQMLGRVLLAEGDLEQARAQGEIALAWATEAQDRWDADCRELLGAIHSMRAEWPDAEASFSQALVILSGYRYLWTDPHCPVLTG